MVGSKLASQMQQSMPKLIPDKCDSGEICEQWSRTGLTFASARKPLLLLAFVSARVSLDGYIKTACVVNDFFQATTHKFVLQYKLLQAWLCFQFERLHTRCAQEFRRSDQGLTFVRRITYRNNILELRTGSFSVEPIYLIQECPELPFRRPPDA